MGNDLCAIGYGLWARVRSYGLFRTYQFFIRCNSASAFHPH